MLHYMETARTGRTEKRRKSISPLESGWMTLAIIVLCAVFISADWYYYYRTRRSLDDEFGRRLTVLAELVSARIEAGSPELIGEPWTEPAKANGRLMAKLENLRETHAISNILVIREDGTTLLSLRRSLYPVGEQYPHWDMDFPAIMSALEGKSAATKLSEVSRGAFLKAGYAPLPSASQKAGAVVAVEASPAFLEGLNRLRLILIVVTGASVLGAVLFAVFAFRATVSLIRARESLMHAETLATMGRMAAGVAHEIRNPLFIIRSAAEKLRDSCTDRAEEIESFIIEEVDRLNGILGDYLLFARDEPARRIPLDLASTLSRCLRNMRESARGAGVEFVVDIGVAAAPFFGEEKRLQQAFLNVLLNARQSIAEGGKIHVALTSDERRYVIRIADTGSGIPEKDLERIFEPFYTTKPSGSGLGLAISRRIIEDHGGEIAVVSASGTGTEVTITLPVHRGDNRTDEAAAAGGAAEKQGA
jgi:signal transduction histidine kinase